jgi:hypothetical protein
MRKILSFACCALWGLYAGGASANAHMDAAAAAVLKNCAGTWDATVHMGTETSKASEVVRVIGDGMWLVTDFEATMGGMPFTGHGVTGFDPKKKKYVGVWVDTMSPHPMHMEGSLDATGKKMTMHGESVDPMSGKPVKHEMVETYVDADTREFVMSMVGADGKAVESMKIVYKRRK